MAITFALVAGPVAATDLGGARIDSMPVNLTLPAAATETVQFDVFFPSRDSAGLQALLEAQQTPGSPDFHRWLTPAEFAARFGPDPAELARGTALLNQNGFQVVAAHVQGVRVAGTAGALQSRFGVALDHVPTTNGHDSLIARNGFVLPAALQALGAKVVAFGPVRKQIDLKRIGHAVPLNRNSATGGYWFSDLKQAYDAPSYQSLAGNGRTIAILMAGDVLDSDMELYFGNENLPEPELIHINVNGFGAQFDPTSDGAFEATLDVQQSGGMAPNATIRLYNVATLGDEDLLIGLGQILADNASDVVSMSFGSCELLYTAAYNGGVDQSSIIGIWEQVFQQGSAQGITFVASSGDNGALQCPALTKPEFVAGASHPATSPTVTAVGGTNLVTVFNKGTKSSAYVSENANGDPLVMNNPWGGTPLAGGFWGSGGGPSIFFSRPSWQTIQANARETPDLSLHMGGCPGTAIQPCGPERSFDIEIFAGQVTGVVGTSASAPAFAGVVALLDQMTGTRAGNVGPMIYRLSAAEKLGGGPYRRNIPGFNGVYSSGQPVAIPGGVVPTLPTYDMVIGTGSLDIRQFLGATNLPAAGVPGTPSNP